MLRVCLCETVAAFHAEVRTGRALGAAVGAGLTGRLVPVMNHQIPDIGNPGERIAKDENGILLVQRVGKKRQCPHKTQPPKRHRHDHLFLLLSGIPLDHETREKGQVAQPTNDLPRAPLDPQEFAVIE